MKILFTSDLHGNWNAIENFCNELVKPEYLFGVISGDILDDGIPGAELDTLISESEFSDDDFVPELQGADESFDEYARKQIEKIKDPNQPFQKMLQMKEDKIRHRFSVVGKNIYLIPGNHDQTSWLSGDNIVNLDRIRVEVGELNLVGYRWTELDRSENEHKVDIKKLRRKVDRNTILVTHRPAFGCMDEVLDIQDRITHIGSKRLARLINLKKPILHLFGHVHNSFGHKGISVNGAYPRSRAFVRIDIDSGQVQSIEFINIEEIKYEV